MVFVQITVTTKPVCRSVRMSSKIISGWTLRPGCNVVRSNRLSRCCRVRNLINCWLLTFVQRLAHKVRRKLGFFYNVCFLYFWPLYDSGVY